MHRYLGMSREFFGIAGILVVQYDAVDGFTGICGARRFVFANCSVSAIENKARITEITTGRNIRVFKYYSLFGTLRYH